MRQEPVWMYRREHLLSQSRTECICSLKIVRNLCRVTCFPVTILRKTVEIQLWNMICLSRIRPISHRRDIPGLMEEVRSHDPVLALDGKEDGLYFYREITAQAGKYLRTGGWLMYEIGCDQGEAVVG